MNFKTKRDLLTSGDIKREALAQLRGNWVSAVLLALIPGLFAVFFLSRTASDVVNNDLGYDLIELLLEIIHAYLLTGVSYALLDFLRGKTDQIETLTGSVSAFKSKYFANLFLVKIIKYVYIFLWSLLLVIPGIIKAYAYSQAEYIYKDVVDRTGEQPNPRECIEESQQIMRGKKMDLFVLQLSFIGWFILSIILLGIPSLWLTPYTNMSHVIFYENITKGRYLERQNNQQTSSRRRPDRNSPYYENEEIGKDPDDFRDFDDF